MTYSDVHGCRAITLTHGVIALVDDDVAETIGRFSWYANNFGGRRWYAVKTGSDKVLMHKAILPVANGMDVDHRKHHPMSDLLIDNRRANLRESTRSQNMQNADIRTDNKSGFKGVTWDASRGKWSASLMLNYKRVALGRFDSKIEAALAYDRAAEQTFGEFAKTNASLGRYDMAA